MRLAIVDIERHRLIEVDGKVLHGECLRCGRCCFNARNEPCEHLFVDSWKNHERTEPIYSCKLHFQKPVYCVLFPLPEKRIEGCGFHWEDKE